MVTVTERAATELQELLKSQNAPQGYGVKLAPSGDGRVEMKIEEPTEGDEVTRHGGEPLLIVDSTIVDSLSGAEVDFESETVDGKNSPGFTLRPLGS